MTHDEYSKYLTLIINSSDIFLQTSASSIDYKAITNLVLELSGAKYCAMNIYNDDGTEYTTVSLEGISDNIKNAIHMLGFEVVGKTWKHDSVRAVKLGPDLINYFESLLALTGKTIPRIVTTSIQHAFSLGRIIVAKIQFEHVMLGDFTIIFNKGAELTNPQLLELFLRQCGLFLSRIKYEREILSVNARKDTILSVVSHDLRGPLGSFKNLINFILDNDGKFDKPQIMNVISELSVVTTSVYDLVENLLNWAQVNKNKSTLDIQEVYVKSILDAVQATLAMQLHAKNIHLDLKLDNTTLIMADRDSILIIVRNIISNAIKFSKLNGRIEIYSRANKKQISVLFKDYGLGMSVETLDKLNHNVRVSNIGTNQETGSGLGLSFCKEMLALHKGELFLTSSPNKGTTVELRFANPNIIQRLENDKE